MVSRNLAIPLVEALRNRMVFAKKGLRPSKVQKSIASACYTGSLANVFAARCMRRPYRQRLP